MSKAGIITFLVAVFYFATGTIAQTNAQTPTGLQLSYPNTISAFDELPISNLQVAPVLSSSKCSSFEAPQECSQVCTGPVPVIDETDEIKAENSRPIETIEPITQEPITEDLTLSSPTITPIVEEPKSDSSILDSDKIFDLVNQYRNSVGLASFERENSVCELASARSSEIISEIASGVLHSGLYNRPLPYWIWENAKYGSNEEGTVAWWIASPIHHKSIVGDYKYSCVKCTGSYCSQLFTSFAPK